MVKVSIVRLVGDFIVLAVLGLGLLLYDHFGQPVKRGLNCDDDSLRYPYKEDTVTRLACALTGGGVCIGLIILFETLRILVENKECQERLRGEACVYHLGRFKLHRLAVRLWLFIDSKRHIYKTDFQCTEADYPAWVTKDSRMSFPSGHAAFSFYSMVFAIIYLQARVYWPLFSRIGRPAIQVMCGVIAVYISLSRISDYKHHWSDVFAGAILGTFVAVVVSILIGRFLERRELPPKAKYRVSGEPGDELLLDPIPDHDPIAKEDSYVRATTSHVTTTGKLHHTEF